MAWFRGHSGSVGWIIAPDELADPFPSRRFRDSITPGLHGLGGPRPRTRRAPSRSRRCRVRRRGAPGHVSRGGSGGGAMAVNYSAKEEADGHPSGGVGVPGGGAVGGGGGGAVKTRKPDNTAFKQQRLPAWQPILTAGTVLPAFFIIGLIFIPIGIGIFVTSNNIREYEVRGRVCPDGALGARGPLGEAGPGRASGDRRPGAACDSGDSRSPPGLPGRGGDQAGAVPGGPGWFRSGLTSVLVSRASINYPEQTPS